VSLLLLLRRAASSVAPPVVPPVVVQPDDRPSLGPPVGGAGYERYMSPRTIAETNDEAMRLILLLT
jgi:hypothetical protein